MVDLRTRPVSPEPDEQEPAPLSTLMPPSPELMDRLRAEFEPYIPDRAPAQQVAEQVAEMRGAWRVIHYLQSITNANKEGN